MNWQLDASPEPTTLVLPPDAVSLDEANLAIEMWEFYSRKTLDPTQRLWVQAVMAERSDGRWAAQTTGRAMARQNGKGDRNAPVVPVPAASNLETITLSARITSAACTGNVTNTATIAGFQAPYTDSTTANNTGTATVTTLACNANLQAAKTNNVNTLITGSTTSYTVTFSNLGPSAADNATVTDVVSAGLSACTVASCSASGGSPVAACPATPANLLLPGGVTIPSFPSGAAVRFIVNCNVTASGT